MMRKEDELIDPDMVFEEYIGFDNLIDVGESDVYNNNIVNSKTVPR